MEPMLPPDGGHFESVALELHREAAALAQTAHPFTRRALTELVRVVNSLYSNLIEGARTTPAEIEAAMRADYSQDPERVAVQRLAAAHVRTEAAITAEIDANPTMSVTSPDFLRRIHAALYGDLPESERIVRSPSDAEQLMIPGEWRTSEVTVGRHIPPSPEAVPSYMRRFNDVYRPEALTEVRRVIAFAASHHRFAWIHPFLDGNGRVGRLLTTAYARRISLDGGGLWSIARGLARYQHAYYDKLAAADERRRSDTDGRGPLSLAGLEEWCDFIVRVSLDQITYMRALLGLDRLADRLRGYAAFQSAGGGPWRPEAGTLLAALVTRGEMPRGEALKFLPGRERTARALLSIMLRDGILVSNSHRAPVRLAFPEHVARIVFANLFATPAGRAEAQSAAAGDAGAVRETIPRGTVPSTKST
jgi:Fic family protein